MIRIPGDISRINPDVMMKIFDPEFDAASVAVSRNLANEYRKIALQNHAAFLNASDFAAPSVTDR